MIVYVNLSRDDYTEDRVLANKWYKDGEDVAVCTKINGEIIHHLTWNGSKMNGGK